ncbi:MAG: septal ring lytic transglycosylase RlpA family protein [Chitinophagaceae bacterium]|nr:septal ring lytic transglycosylase RlpA family protein [Chitinophagaceae bacterium]
MHVNLNRSAGTLSKKFAKVFFALVGLLLCSGVLPANDNLPDIPESKNTIRTGKASFYSNSFQGRKTASGEIFSQSKLTCASNLYPLGTWLKITNKRNGKSVIVKVNDRMHPRMKRVVDLSKLAAEELGMIKSGVAEVQVESLGRKEPVPGSF